MEYISRGHYMIKLIKITIQYIIWAYATDRHILIIGISLLQEGWWWHCYSHPAKLCLSVYQVTFDYSTLKAHISKTTNDRNEWISDSESRHLEGSTKLKPDSRCTNNIHAQRDAQKHCLIYLHTTLSNVRNERSLLLPYAPYLVFHFFIILKVSMLKEIIESPIRTYLNRLLSSLCSRKIIN